MTMRLAVIGTAGLMLSGTVFGGMPSAFAHWGLDEIGGSLAFEDSSGYYGTYVGGPTLGLPGSLDPCNNFAVGFDGVNDRVLVSGQSTAMNMGGDSFTIVVRFRKTTDSSDWMKLVNKGLTFSGTPANAGYGLQIRDEIIEFNVGDGSTVGRATAAEPGGIGWHFVAGVLDRTAAEIRLYLDPDSTSPTASGAISGLGSLDTNIEFAIGALDRSPVSNASEHFLGWIDDVAVYRQALTGKQVLALAQGAPCLADLAAPFGLLDLADVTAFVGAFLSGQSEADLAAPCGVFDLGDVGVFVSTFIGGCE